MIMEQNEKLSYFVTEKIVTERADLFITKKFPQFSRSQIQKLINSENITINSNPIKASTEIINKDNIEITIPINKKNKLQKSKISLEIIHEQSNLVIINKPKGIVVHPSKGHSNNTVVNALMGMKIEFESNMGETKPWLIHRLDKDTSGLLIVAKNKKEYEYLIELQKERKIKKYYLAVVSGIPDKKYATIDAPISRNKSHRKKMSINTSGRKSLTTYKVLKSNSKMSLIELELHTGRTHQIRVHMQAIGHPIIGDKLYGKKSTLIDRQLLHAYKLEFKDSKNKKISIENKPDKDMSEFIEIYFDN
ncbi:MAG: RNA pseudouridine synthase [Chloroflexi bacterium]|nr:RNA pseudouridine synthase [Chloroflexota bacterium]|tara:strand:- start:5358 stop:6275 length:918 start_codon:yes stop_codon:yes gene_type:complete